MLIIRVYLVSRAKNDVDARARIRAGLQKGRRRVGRDRGPFCVVGRQGLVWPRAGRAKGRRIVGHRRRPCLGALAKVGRGEGPETLGVSNLVTDRRGLTQNWQK